MIKDFREVESDSDLERMGLEYHEYKSSGFGLFMDCLRYNGVGVTDSPNIAKWAKRHGCNVSRNGENYTVRFAKE